MQYSSLNSSRSLKSKQTKCSCPTFWGIMLHMAYTPNFWSMDEVLFGVPLFPHGYSYKMFAFLDLQDYIL